MVYVIICAVAVIAVIAFLIGMLKGYSNTKTWAVEYLFAAFITVLIYSIAKVENAIANACLTLGTAIVLLLLFAFLSGRIKSFIFKQTADARLRNYYETYGEREEHFLEIIDSIELNDRKAYERLTHRHMKEKSGPAGVADRICGGLNLVIKALVVCAITAVVVLLALQFTQLSFVCEGGALYGVYTSGIWVAISPYIFDFLLVVILQFALRAGYRAGILRSLWFIVELALVAGAAYVSYHLAFRVDSFISLAAGLSDVSFIASAGSAISAFLPSFTAQTIAQAIILVGIFIIALILVLIIGAIVSSIIRRIREGHTVSAVDGVIGSFIFTVIMAGILLYVGMLLYSLSGFSFMQTFNSYCYTVGEDGETWSAAIFSSIYSKNPLNSIESFAQLQAKISGWFN
ncbi:MAG: hypothetical protein LUI60_02375 [Clostridia bacterium]|nr:hypothetical protein [Clostridia bacterium]